MIRTGRTTIDEPTETMIAKLLELFTGKDDLKRIAYKGEIGLLNK